MNLWLSIWAAVGPLIGVLLGSYLSTLNQRRQWISDNRKNEFREIITTLASCHAIIVKHYGTPVFAASVRIKLH